MKKNIIYTLLFIVTVGLLTACGTNSKENPPEPEGPYTFFNATTPVKITKPTEVNGTIAGPDNNVSVQLLKNGLVEAGQSVQMKPFDLRYGSVLNSVVDTDANGNAIFIYQAPSGSNYDSIRGQDITIQAVFLDPEVDATSSASSATADILLIQDFVLQFR
jgi:hypothetical protein